MLVKDIVYINSMQEYHVRGFCGHILVITKTKWYSFLNELGREIFLHGSICAECETEFANMAKILHFEYKQKTGD